MSLNGSVPGPKMNCAGAPASPFRCMGLPRYWRQSSPRTAGWEHEQGPTPRTFSWFCSRMPSIPAPLSPVMILALASRVASLQAGPSAAPMPPIPPRPSPPVPPAPASRVAPIPPTPFSPGRSPLPILPSPPPAGGAAAAAAAAAGLRAALLPAPPRAAAPGSPTRPSPRAPGAPGRSSTSGPRGPRSSAGRGTRPPCRSRCRGSSGAPGRGTGG
mmetsp:Transcript_17946/g.50857  ORF Transcript_17946/g.50857 Transcript_17946/m.50857 type:complete len:215 (-) Transcript_17946:412-1056(-)